MKAQVLLPKIFNFPFTYNSKTETKIGSLVEVPFGSKKEIGVIWMKYEVVGKCVDSILLPPPVRVDFWL